LFEKLDQTEESKLILKFAMRQTKKGLETTQ